VAMEAAESSLRSWVLGIATCWLPARPNDQSRIHFPLGRLIVRRGSVVQDLRRYWIITVFGHGSDFEAFSRGWAPWATIWKGDPGLSLGYLTGRNTYLFTWESGTPSTRGIGLKFACYSLRIISNKAKSPCCIAKPGVPVHSF
jgi:hypothetical protein